MPSWGQGKKETLRVLWSLGTWREGLLKKGHWGPGRGNRIDEDSEAVCWSAKEAHVSGVTGARGIKKYAGMMEDHTWSKAQTWVPEHKGTIGK